MWKLFICHDTREHPQISQQQTVSSSSFPISGVTAVWRGVICERFSGKPATFFFKLKKKKQQSQWFISRRSCRDHDFYFDFSGKVFEVLFDAVESEQPNGDGSFKKTLQVFSEQSPMIPTRGETPALSTKTGALRFGGSGYDPFQLVSFFSLYSDQFYFLSFFFLIAYFTQLLN